jgi:phosphate transport system protein
MLDSRLTELRRELIGYASHVEGMIDTAVRGLIRRDRRLLVQVIEIDEPRSNNTEIAIDESCTAIIAQYEPRAKDLRTVLMILQINNDLERIADHAVNTAESGLFLVGQPELKPLIDIPRMAEVTVGMLKDSITAFINEDAALGHEVCERDSVVDALASQVLRELITFMIADTSTIERALHLLKIAGNLERTADLSTNICEDVIYMVEGKIIKHGKCGEACTPSSAFSL